jgi:hypothetical protein
MASRAARTKAVQMVDVERWLHAPLMPLADREHGQEGTPCALPLGVEALLPWAGPAILDLVLVLGVNDGRASVAVLGDCHSSSAAWLAHIASA